MARRVSPARTGERSAAPVSTTIVRRVATATDQSILELPTLYDTIDPEALDAVVDSAGPESSPLEIRFTYAGHRVTVDGDGAVTIEPSTE